MKRPIRLQKRDLPIRLVIDGEDGASIELELAPASKKKLGAYVRRPQGNENIEDRNVTGR